MQRETRYYTGLYIFNQTVLEKTLKITITLQGQETER